MAKLGLTLFIIFASAGILADVVSPYDPWERFEPFAAPSTSHWLGTNDIGNDVLSELIHGTRVSILVGLGTALIATLIGVLVGITSGYFRGHADEVLMAATDVVLMVPRIPLVIIIVAFTRPSYWIIMMVLGLVWWTTTARVVRSKTLQVREMPFVTGDRSMGFSHAYILVYRHHPQHPPCGQSQVRAHRRLGHDLGGLAVFLGAGRSVGEELGNHDPIRSRAGWARQRDVVVVSFTGYLYHPVRAVHRPDRIQL